MATDPSSAAVNAALFVHLKPFVYDQSINQNVL